MRATALIPPQVTGGHVRIGGTLIPWWAGHALSAVFDFVDDWNPQVDHAGDVVGGRRLHGSRAQDSKGGSGVMHSSRASLEFGVACKGSSATVVRLVDRVVKQKRGHAFGCKEGMHSSPGRDLIQMHQCTIF